MFQQDEITDKEVEDLLYGISAKQEKVKSSDDYLDLVKEKVLKCYSIRGKKQLGDRISAICLLLK